MIEPEIKQISVIKLLIFVFVPALLILAAYTWFMQFRAAVPPLLSFALVILAVLIPSEIGVVIYYSKKETGKFNLQSAFVMNEKIPALKIFGISIILMAFAAAAFIFLSSVESGIVMKPLFRGIPEYFKITDFFRNYTNYPSWIVAVTLALYVAANGILGPIAEELFFRGFLMPRINRFGNWAPVIITVLFSAYHLFSPWEFVTRIVAFFPMAYCVYKKKNIYIGIAAHCMLNIGSIAMNIVNAFFA
jgi:membrane protease YdiL (CAAX protease family)